VCRLATQIRNVPWFQDWEPEYFTAVLRMESALQLHNKGMRESLEKHLDRSFDSLQSIKQGLADLVEEYKKRGSVGIKLAHAYGRTLASDNVPEDTASNIFAKALGGGSLSPGEVKQLQDHIIFFLAGLAGEMNQVFQIHTGVQGNWGNIPDSDPLLLIPLIHANKSTRFDLFHAGYPYSREIGMLGKHAPNVWLNMCWMYVITMEGSRQSLNEWIDLVPGDKLLGFGSDVGWPEFIYGHLVMARSCIADILAQKVERDFLSKKVALDLARKMLRDNAIRLYSLPDDV
jgi:predicted TIM-barrel fold metal-dependent hydrolase